MEQRNLAGKAPQWGPWFAEPLDQAQKANPRSKIRMVQKSTGFAFGGSVPPEWDGSVVTLEFDY
jgi:hypothetical protein